MKRLIFTVAIGEECVKFAEEITFPPLREYAEKYHADFVNWTEFYLDVSCSYWKGLLWALENQYDQILCIDSDIIVKSDAENIFDVPHNGFAMRRGICKDAMLRHLRRDLDPNFEKQHMFNSGVMLTESNCLKKLMNNLSMMEDLFFKSFHHKCVDDQMILCSVLAKLNIDVEDLTFKWNCPSSSCGLFDITNETLNNSHFIHLQGKYDKHMLLKAYKNRFRNITYL